MAAGDVSVGITTPKGFRCAKFDGVDDYVDGDVISEITNTSSFTISLFKKQDLFGTQQSYISSVVDASNRVTIQISSGNYIKASIYNGSSHKGSVSTASSNTDSDWQHIVYVYYGNDTGRMWINNVEQAGALAPIAPITTTGLSIGNRLASPSDSYFNGTIKDVRIYNRALSAAEVLKLYQSGGDVTQGLVRHWKLDEAEGETTAVDSSGFGNDGTVTGALFGNYESDLAAAIKAQRGAATDSFFLCDIANSNQVLHTQITEA